MPGECFEGEVIVGAVCNGRQAGGGQQLAPHARIDDGLLEVVGLLRFAPTDLLQVLSELADTETSGTYVKRFRVPWAECESKVDMPINLDGEPFHARKTRFEVLPGALRAVLPADCPMLG